MKCKYCGAEINEDVKFCTECGHEVLRKRSVIDPLPELDGYRRIRNKVYMFDEHSKPLNIYCFVMIAILAVVFIVGLILKIEFLLVFAGIFLGIMLLMLWANNRQAKRVRFAIGRPLVIILPILMIQVIIGTIFMYSTRNSFDDTFVNSGSEQLNTFELADNEPQSEYSYIPGTYVHEYTEEIGGEMIDVKDSVILHEDHSCEVSFQDTITGEWTETKLIMNNGEEIEYTVDGNELYLNQPFGWVTFTRS